MVGFDKIHLIWIKGIIMKKKLLIVSTSIIILSVGFLVYQSHIKSKDAFFEAVRNGDITKIEEEINNGFDIDSSDKYGYTALHYAASHNQIQVVEILLKNNANLNIEENKLFRTPLDIAVEKKHEQIIAILKKNKTNQN